MSYWELLDSFDLTSPIRLVCSQSEHKIELLCSPSSEKVIVFQKQRSFFSNQSSLCEPPPPSTLHHPPNFEPLRLILFVKITIFYVSVPVFRAPSVPSLDPHHQFIWQQKLLSNTSYMFLAVACVSHRESLPPYETSTTMNHVPVRRSIQFYRCPSVLFLTLTPQL